MSSEIESGTTDLHIARALAHNIRALPKAFSWTALLSGLLVVRALDPRGILNPGKIFTPAQ
jgi:hypothetical protein